jgi:hypothetical protein
MYSLIKGSPFACTSIWHPAWHIHAIFFAGIGIPQGTFPFL